MKVGKVSENVLKRAVFKQIRRRRGEVLVSARIGEDCAAVELGEDEVAVLSTDPITGTAHEIGTLAVHVTANDIGAFFEILLDVKYTHIPKTHVKTIVDPYIPAIPPILYIV